METVKLQEKYEALQKAARNYARRVSNRKTIFGGSYSKKATSLDGVVLLERVKLAKTFGYETHLRAFNDSIEIYYLPDMPPTPTDVLYG